MVQTRLNDCNLSETSFYGAELYGAELRNANLRGSEMRGCRLHFADLRRAELQGADLYRVDFIGTRLAGANLKGAKCRLTAFTNVDLSEVVGLVEISHRGPSPIDVSTLERSSHLPESFLRGCGLSEPMIAYMPSLLKVPIQFHSCFVSYSSADTEFATRLHADLQSRGVRCWFAPEDMKIGGRIRESLDEPIQALDRLLLILSATSIASSWVEKEVETAMERERLENRPLLFPIRIDDSVMTASRGWSADIRRTRHIGDFRSWKNHDQYVKSLDRLLRDLRLGGP